MIHTWTNLVHVPIYIHGHNTNRCSRSWIECNRNSCILRKSRCEQNKRKQETRDCQTTIISFPFLFFCNIIIHTGTINHRCCIYGMNQKENQNLARLESFVNTCYLVQYLYDGPEAQQTNEDC